MQHCFADRIEAAHVEIVEVDLARELAQVGLTDLRKVLVTSGSRTARALWVALYDLVSVPETDRPAVGVGSRNGTGCIATHSNEPAADVAPFQVIEHRQTFRIHGWGLLPIC